MFYFLLWSFISTFLLGFWLWSSYVLYRQKVAWRQYAEKRKMRYEGGGFYDSPKIAGIVEGYTMAAFTGDHSQLDARSQRRLSSVEVSLKTCLSSQMYLATGGMVPIMSALALPQEHQPEIQGWDDSFVIAAKEQAIAAAYFTPERLDAVLSLTKIKNLWVVVMFSDGQGLLRIDVPDPVIEPKRLDVLLKKLVEIASVLELKKGEDVAIIRKAREIKDGQSVIKLENEAVFTQGAALSFELEDEEFSQDVQSDEPAPKKKKPTKKSD